MFLLCGVEFSTSTPGSNLPHYTTGLGIHGTLVVHMSLTTVTWV